MRTGKGGRTRGWILYRTGTRGCHGSVYQWNSVGFFLYFIPGTLFDRSVWIVKKTWTNNLMKNYGNATPRLDRVGGMANIGEPTWVSHEGRYLDVYLSWNYRPGAHKGSLGTLLSPFVCSKNLNKTPKLLQYCSYKSTSCFLPHQTPQVLSSSLPRKFGSDLKPLL